MSKAAERDASGLYAQLGAQADEILRLADQAEATAVQEILRQLQPNGKPKGPPVPRPPRLNRPIALGQSVSYVEVNALLMSPMWNVRFHRSSQVEPYVSTAGALDK